MKHLINEFWVVEIPEGAGDICFPEQDFGHVIQFKSLNLANKYVWQTITLTPGNWKLIGISDEMSDKQAATVVEQIESFGRVKRWKDYEFPDSGFYSALDSFKILLHTKSLTKRYAIIQQIKTM